jgi:magnesium transporter
MKTKHSDFTKKAGLPPESLVYTGIKKPVPVEIELLVFDDQNCERIRTDDLKKINNSIDRKRINLLIINNLANVTLIESIGEIFNISNMMLEDVLNITQLPKVEESGDQLLLTLKMLEYPKDDEFSQQHISLILGDYYVLVFKDFENKVFEDIKTRIINGKSKARQKGPDYLFYLLTDTLIDNFYHIVNELNNRIDAIEEKLLEKPEEDYIQNIYYIKQTLSDMRGTLYPLREALLNIVQGDYSLIEDSTITFLHDVKDHINHIIHMYEAGRDTLSDLIDLNSSNNNKRLNRSMKILTIITTLFIPLTLIAGIYGMNFKFIPELNWKAGYPLSIILMFITGGFMFYIMKRNKLL